MEWWRRWRYPARSHKAGISDDLADFEAWFEGPWTPELAKQMPTKQLLEGLGKRPFDRQMTLVIERELERRNRSPAPMVANFISALALIVAILAYFKGH